MCVAYCYIKKKYEYRGLVNALCNTQVLLCLFPGVWWLWHFLYNVGPHQVSNRYIYTFVVSRAVMAGAASPVGDADSSRAPGLTSSLLGSVSVHRGALLLVPQWPCISSVVFCYLKRYQLDVCHCWCHLYRPSRDARNAQSKYELQNDILNKCR